MKLPSLVEESDSDYQDNSSQDDRQDSVCRSNKLSTSTYLDSVDNVVLDDPEDLHHRIYTDRIPQLCLLEQHLDLASHSDDGIRLD